MKEDGAVRKFFIGRAIGTIVVLILIGIYWLLKYGLHLF